MMYKCRNCKHVFEACKLKKFIERHDDYYTEYFDLCPVCSSEDLEETLCCKICGEDEFLKEELVDGKVCKYCIEDFVPERFDDEAAAKLAILRYNLTKNEQKGDD